MKNLVFIGMPACGKTTVAKIVAEKLRRPFYDLDAMIEAQYGTPIPEIFEREGEEAFREKESAIVRTASRYENAVLSCGGGVVLRPENMRLLKENGVVVYLKRDVNLLSAQGRPLSKDTDTLKHMEKVRAPLYERYADLTIENDTMPEETANRIVRSVYETSDH